MQFPKAAMNVLGQKRDNSPPPGAVEYSPEVASQLANELMRNISGEVRFDAGSRALYSTDASNYRQFPLGVVVPRSKEDVVRTMAISRDFGAPVLSRGGGTSLAGQCCNVGVVMDMSKHMHYVLEIDPDNSLARVQPGTVLDDLRKAAEQYHLTFGPDPATHSHCTLGGMLGNNSCGVHSIMAGKTVDNVEELEILTYDGLRMWVGPTSEDELAQIISEGGRRGEIYARLKALRDKYADLIRENYPDIPRRVSGYNLEQLLPENGFNVARALVGTESTCVTFLEAKLRLIHSRPARALLVLGYADVYSAGDHVPEIMEFGPVGLEGIDDQLVRFMKRSHLHPEDIGLLPEGGGWLLVEFGGETKEEAHERAKELMDALEKKGHSPSMKLYDDKRQEDRVWEIRESGLGATAHVPGINEAWPGWEDAAVHPDHLGDYLREFRRLLDESGYACSLYGHFGDGCVHVRIDFDLRCREGIDNYLSFIDLAVDLVVKYGGSLSGEHGDGQARGSLLPKMFGDDLIKAFGEFKTIWDPAGKMNPGKVVDPYLPDENLRLGVQYEPWEPETHFQYPYDRASFSQAALRCVGVGECRREEGGTMCPSYMVTREEMHSTRGRARLLFEMLQGDVVKDGWKDEHVFEALDLCLACKGCKGDCPVHVDMATYKAEFLSHYYEGRLRPLSAYLFGMIYWGARLASLFPGAANFFTQTPGFSHLAKAVIGIAPERKIPMFANQTFKSWFNQRGVKNEGMPQVLLWPDTFNNHFHPETAKAAVEVLEAASFQVTIPKPSLCCGRPLYEAGMLGLAKHLLRQVMDALRPQIRAGITLVGLEPSCAAVFRDELINLFPHDEDASRLSKQSFTLSEFLQQKAIDFEIPKLEREAVVHGHCHHKAIMQMYADEEVLNEIGLDYNLLDSGCCGMAGAFGFEKGEHYNISVGAGERVLLPAVRDAPNGTLIVADGFSCREQIMQTTDRKALHMAQVIQMALREGPAGPKEDYPERNYVTVTTPPSPQKAALVGAGIAVAGGLILGWLLRKRRRRNI